MTTEMGTIRTETTTGGGPWVLGVDPGLRSCGWALLDLAGAVVRLGCIRTAANRGAVGDEQRRLSEVMQSMRPIVLSASRVVVEWPSSGGFARGPLAGNALSAGQTGKCAAAVYGLAVGLGLPVMLPAPTTWRTELGAKRGRDELLHAEIRARHGAALAGVRVGDMPHVLDAIGLAEFRLARASRAANRGSRLLPNPKTRT